MVYFIFVSSLIAYYIFGHQIISEYKDFKFIVLKLLTSFFLGSIDILDQTNNEASNKLKQTNNVFDTYSYILKI